ncbi:hypothetical protein [Rhodobacteraceae bacterium DSL-40]|uniref:hypothetical protein n=1 Tax=Amaricoccus sp. B4 TaxID=3368557 RepID=UPI000DAD8E2B
MTFDVMRPGEGDIVWAVADRLRFLGGVEGPALELVEVEILANSGTPAPEPQPALARLGAAMTRHGITVPATAG